MPAKIKVLMIGDVAGPLGCAMLQKSLPSLKAKYQADAVIVNGENAAENGRGITPKLVDFFMACGVNVITTGNHIWAKKEIIALLSSQSGDRVPLLRPANFPNSTPGSGLTFFDLKFETKNSNPVVQIITVGVLNLQCRIFMKESLDCPFRTADTALSYMRSKTKIILVDMHAETSAEKIGLGFYLDGRVSAVAGTHTHVPTADARILPKGTAFITDLGFTGAYNSMIGMQKDVVLSTFLTQMPQKFVVDILPPAILSGVCITIDTQTGLADKIENFSILDHDVKA